MKIFIYPLTLCFLATLAYSEEKISKYFIAIKKNEANGLTTLDSYTPLLPPQNKFYADPFLFEYEGIHYLFFEDCDYKKGVISYITLDSQGVFSKPQVALELPIHLSFPHVFEDQGEIYMTPETYQYQSISLYKAIQFPDQWERQKALVQGEHFSDPILFKFNGYYWLFSSIHKDQLCIYYAKELHSPFIPHPINLRRIKGRNAGSVFFTGNRMIRPVMDCSIKYGKSIILKEIILLTPTQFIEKTISVIEPNWAANLVGTHSYSQNDSYIAYDGERLIFQKEDKSYSTSD